VVERADHADGRQPHDDLAARARAGVRVRVMVDSLGGRGLDGPLAAQMRDAGVMVHFFRPYRTYKIWNLNLRTHRRALVCDQEVAFTGGVGIAQEWTGDARTADEWRETHDRVRGPAVDGSRPSAVRRRRAAVTRTYWTVVERLFTVDEARAVLADAQRSIAAFIDLRAEFAELRWTLEHDPTAAVGGIAELKALEARLDTHLSPFRDRGVQVKGFAPLLLDFPATRDGQPVLLCWLEGEPDLAWWHPTELGLMGRRRL